MVKNKPRAALIINAKSRKGQKFFFKVVELLEAQGIEVEASSPIHNPELLQTEVKKAIDNGYKLVIIGGGDGTLSAVVKYFAYRDVVMGIIPLGTGNSFARSLGLPLDLAKVVEVITRGKVARINLGQVGRDYYANVASIGFNAKIAKQTPDKLKKYLGYFAYGMVGLKLFIGRPSFKATMKINEDSVEARLNQLVIANGSFFGITKIYPEAHIDNNELSVVAINATSRWQILRSWLGFMIGRPKMFAGVTLYSAKKISVETAPKQTVDVDGEASISTPIKASVAKEALKIMVPLDFQDKK